MHEEAIEYQDSTSCNISLLYVGYFFLPSMSYDPEGLMIIREL